jgi:hypothetical protein
MVWVLAMVVTLLLAALTASVADSKGQNGALWFFIGLIAPVLGSLIALLALEPAGLGTNPMPTAAEAARDSRVARMLTDNPGLSSQEIAERARSTERDTEQQLAALRFAARDDRGRWRLTDEGEQALVAAS